MCKHMYHKVHWWTWVANIKASMECFSLFSLTPGVARNTLKADDVRVNVWMKDCALTPGVEEEEEEGGRGGGGEGGGGGEMGLSH